MHDLAHAMPSCPVGAADFSRNTSESACGAQQDMARPWLLLDCLQLFISDDEYTTFIVKTVSILSISFGMQETTICHAGTAPATSCQATAFSCCSTTSPPAFLIHSSLDGAEAHSTFASSRDAGIPASDVNSVLSCRASMRCANGDLFMVADKQTCRGHEFFLSHHVLYQQ